jgi:ribosome biogenesis protein ERB1
VLWLEGIFCTTAAFLMAPPSLPRSGRKRKQPPPDSPPSLIQELPEEVGLEMLSGDEGEGSLKGGQAGSGEEEGSVEEFPEIEGGSSEEENSEEEQDESQDESEDESEETASSEDDASDDMHPFPRSKTVISNITGQPKRVYPEIEPDYDSDSSTEDVSQTPCHVHPSVN